MLKNRTKHTGSLSKIPDAYENESLFEMEGGVEPEI